MGFWRKKVETPVTRKIDWQHGMSLCGKSKCVFFMSQTPMVLVVCGWLQYLLREKLATEISIFHLTLVRLGIDKPFL